MTLYEFAQYALVASFFVIVAGYIILRMAFRLSRKSFELNLVTAHNMNYIAQKELYHSITEDDFDDHVASTPGMKPFLHTQS